MNDRFRFRKPVFSKDKKFKKFVYFELFDMPAFTARSSDIIGKEEQCTGLKDANSNLIYEGDILLLDPDDPPALVIWSEYVAMFCLKQEDVCYTFDNCGYFPQEMEVIGNIHEHGGLLVAQTHENPELLEDTTNCSQLNEVVTICNHSEVEK